MRVSGMRSVRPRIFRVLSHFAVIVLSILLCLWMVSGAKAAGEANRANKSNKAAKIIEVSYSKAADDNPFIEVQFSHPIDPKQAQVRFERNFIQLEVQGASAYPAIIRRFPESKSVKKAFAYQFKPELARIRLFVDGKSAFWKNRATIWIDGETLRLNLGKITAKDRLVAQIGSVNRGKKSSEKSSSLTIEERELLDELKKSPSALSKSEGDLFTNSFTSKQRMNPSQAVEPSQAMNSSPAAILPQTSNSLTKVNAKPSIASGIIRLIFSLLIVLTVIAAIAYALKKGLFGKSFTPAKQLNSEIIKTLGNHNLGPNRSLVVVKIVDEVVVLGVTEHSINHVMNLDPEADFAFALKTEKIADQVKHSYDLKSEIQKKISGFKALN